MGSKEDVLHIAHDAITHPEVGKTVAQAATAGAAGTLGLNVYLGYFEKGVGAAVAFMGLLVTTALWRKLRAERREIELRVEVLERELQEGD